MITLNFNTSSFPLTKDEAAFIAESLTNALSDKPPTSPSFNSGMHGHISVMGKKAHSRKHITGKADSKRRSNPQQSDQGLTDC
ncbi:hypothetical protein [Pantoea sp. SORGH_AS_0659]|uniref:hypothetical protein n=1 Tax=Pantoea sp. SORGH_AS_0659 TaxID=3062597 RepID=UPI0028623C4C|nr:hypothetical protein [Pantoea sp. SORGH_AS_0659]MDR6349414.1 hypothetical protein [Pantoea sp. SORGH_AS_0659]